MTIQFGLTDELVNSQFGPVAALAAYYQRQNVLEPLQMIVPEVKKSDYPLANQLTQVLLSILTGCEYSRSWIPSWGQNRPWPNSIETNSLPITPPCPGP